MQFPALQVQILKLVSFVKWYQKIEFAVEYN